MMVFLFLASSLLTTPAGAQVPPSDLERLATCAGQGDDCLREAFFTDHATATPHEWSYQYFVGPTSATSTSDNFVLGLDGTTLLGALNLGGTPFALNGGDVSDLLAVPVQERWFHAAMTYRPGAWRLYLDGELVAQRTDTTGTLQTPNTPFGIGRTDHPTSIVFPGAIGDVRTYHGALSRSEILQGMQNGQQRSLLGGLPDLLSSATHVWRMDEGQGTMIRDAVGGVDGTLLGTTTWVTQHEGTGILPDDDGAIQFPNVRLATRDGFTVLGWFRLDQAPTGQAALASQWSTQQELRFLDAGIRNPGDAQGAHHIQADLNATWDPLVLCRFYLQPGQPQPCADGIAPAFFQYGLDLKWSPTERDRLLSEWRIATPTRGVHDALVRVHGPDATLLHKDTRPHTTGTGWFPEGHLELECAIHVTFPVQEYLTEGQLPPSLGAQSCPWIRLASSLPKEVPLEGDLLWCDTPLMDHRAVVHANRTLEEVLWGASITCRPIEDDDETVTWDDLMGTHREAFAENVTLLVDATTPTDHKTARDGVNETLRRMLADRVAVWWKDLGMPQEGALDDPLFLLNASAHHVVDMTITNIDIGNARVRDAIEALAELAEPGLAALAPIALPVQVNFTSLTGEILVRDFTLHVQDQAPVAERPLHVQYGDERAGYLIAKDPDNRDHREAFEPGTHRPFSFPLVNVTDGAALLGSGLFDVGYAIPVDPSLVGCIRSLWTGHAAGTDTNLANGRLAIGDEATAACALLADPERFELRLFERLTTSIELREGDDWDARATIIGNGLRSLVDANDPNAPVTFSEALTTTGPDRVVTEAGGGPETGAPAGPIRLGAIRIVLQTPHLPPADKREVLTAVLQEFAATVDTFSIEMEEIPLSPALDQAIRDAIDHGALVLAPAGTLPGNASAWWPMDKMLSIHGLAAHPLVITIGNGGLGTGMDPLSRLGPTPLLTPKPDFVAPGPAGTTIGSVMNVLPFAEALQLRGIHDVHVAMAVLSSFATPILSQTGHAATYYEEGHGAIDLSAFLSLPENVQDASDQVASVTGRTSAQVLAEAAGALDITMDQVNQSTTIAVLGALATPSALLTSAASALLLNITIDSPTIPLTPIIDHGIANHERAQTASVMLLDADPVLNATIESLQVLLGESGLNATQADATIKDVTDRIQARTSEGQRVTINLTHYDLFDTIQGDLMYSLYGAALARSLEDHRDVLTATVDGYSEDAVAATQDVIGEWLLSPHYLVDDWDGPIRAKVDINETCIEVPFTGTVQFGLKILGILGAFAERWANTTRADAAAAFLEGLDGFPPAPSGENGEPPCGHELSAWLRQVRDSALALQVIHDAPLGLWNATEEGTGWWNETPLGGAINETLAALGIDPGAIGGDGPRSALDLALRALDDALAVVEAKLNATRIPRMNVTLLTTAALTTNVTRTTDTDVNPIGPYVGIGRVTSHGVRLYNPFTGDLLVERDVTVPLPAFLWNNPTLMWNTSYRDGSPLHINHLLQRPVPQVFNQTRVNTTLWEDGVLLNMTIDRTQEVEREKEQLVALNKTLVELIQTAQAELNETLGTTPLPMWIQQLEEVRNATRERLRELEEEPAKGAPKVPFDLLASWRSDGGVSNATTGIVPLYYLLPGSYELIAPYLYAMLTNMSEEQAYLNPGAGEFTGPLRDVDYEVHRMVADTVDGLQPHDTVPPVRSDAPPSPGSPVPEANATFGYMGYLEIVDHGIKWGPFHQFQFEANGFDPLAAACRVLAYVANNTSTPLRLPGCGDVLLPENVTNTIEGLIERLDCVTGDRKAEDRDTVCEEGNQAQRDLDAACRRAEGSSSCELRKFAEERRKTAERLRGGLMTLLPQERVVVPWPVSITRVIGSDLEAFGFDNESILDRSRTVPENTGLSDATILAAADRWIANLTTEIDDAIRIGRPEKVMDYNFTYPHGIIGHTTDMVSGLDWWHTDLTGASTEEAANAGRVRDLLEGVLDMVSDVEDNSTLRSYMEPLLASTDLELLAAYNTAVGKDSDWRSARLGAGWTPAGVVTEGLLPFRVAAKNLSATAQGMCGRAAGDLSGSPPAYFDCGNVTVPPPANVAMPMTGSNVDPVVLVNELLRDARNGTKTAVDAFVDAVGMAHAGYGWRIERTNDAFVADSRAEALAAEVQMYNPKPLLLHYATPIVVNEAVAARVSAEIVTQDVVAISITTVCEEFAQALHLALDDVELAVSNPASDAIRRVNKVLAILDEQVIFGTNGAARCREYLRTEVLGVPLRTEFSPPESLAVACIDCPKEVRGMAAYQPHQYHPWSRGFAWDTLDYRERGAEHVHQFFLVFPAAGVSETSTTTEKFIVRNLTIQTDTYLGLMAWPLNYSIDYPIRYRANVEDFTLLHAVPDQKPVHLAQGGRGVSVTVEGPLGTRTTPSLTIIPNVAVFPRRPTPPAEPGNFTGDLQSSCPDEAVTGFPLAPEGPYRHYRDIQPFHSDYYWLTEPSRDEYCDRNEIESLEPVHVMEETFNRTGPVMGYPAEEKSFGDAANYIVNLPGLKKEAFTQAELLPLRADPCRLCDPWHLLGSAGPDVGSDIVRGIPGVNGTVARLLVSDIFATTLDVARAVDEGLLGRLEAGNISGRLVAPPNRSPPVEPTPTHGDMVSENNYIVLNATDVHDLMEDPWDPKTKFTFTDVSHTEPEKDGWIPDRPYWFRSAVFDPPAVEDRAAIVAAFSDRAQLTGVNADAPEQTTSPSAHETVQFLAGSGQSGSGLAVYLDASDETEGATVKGLPSSPTTVFNVTVYELGGPFTTGSDCSQVPLFDYVRRFFRCTGYSMIVRLSQDGADSQAPCVAEARSLLTMGALARDHADTRNGSWPRVTDPYLDAYFRHILEGGYTGPPPPVRNEAITVLVNESHTRSADLAHAGGALAQCVLAAFDQGADHVVDVVNATVNGVLVLNNYTVPETDDKITTPGVLDGPERARSAQNVTRIMHPTIWTNGDPTDPGQVASPILAVIQTPAITGWYDGGNGTLSGLFRVNGAESRLDHGDLVLTETDADGNTQAPVTLVSTDRTGSYAFDFNVTHGHTYHLDASVQDVHGNTGQASQTLRVDTMPPLFESTLLSGWVDASSVLRWEARDALSGIRESAVDVDTGNGYTRQATYGGADPDIIAAYLHDLVLKGVDGATHAVRLGVTDIAGNTATSDHTVREDHTDPIFLAPIPTVPDFVNTDLSLQFSAFDARSGMGSLEYNQTGGDTNNQSLSSYNAGVMSGAVAVNVDGHDGQALSFVVQATDNVSRTSSWQDTTRVDLTAPSVSLVLPGVIDGVLDNKTLAADITITDATSGIAKADVYLVNKTLATPVETLVRSFAREQVVETWDDLSLPPWVDVSDPGGTLLFQDQDAHPPGFDMRLGRTPATANEDTRTAVRWDFPGQAVPVDFNLTLEMDWRWLTRWSGVTHHRSGMTVIVRDDTETKRLHYVLHQSGTRGIPVETGTDKYVDLRSQAPVERKWALLQADLDVDLEGFADESRVIGFELWQEERRDGNSADFFTWFDDIRFTRGGPGQAVQGRLQVPVWHSGTYHMRVDAVDVAGNVQAAGSAADAFLTWITPVPNLDLAGIVVDRLQVRGVPIAPRDGLVVSGNGLDFELAHELPTDTRLRVTYPDGFQRDFTADSASGRIPLEGLEYSPGTHQVELMAWNTRGSWNRTTIDLTVPERVLLMDDMEGDKSAWTLSVPGDVDETAAFVTRTAATGWFPLASGSTALHLVSNKTSGSYAGATRTVSAEPGARFTARITLEDPQRSGRSEWFHLLTPEGPSGPRFRVGFLDDGSGLDVGHSTTSGASVTHNVSSLVYGHQYALELRHDAGNWTLLVDGDFVGRWPAITDGNVTRLRFGAETGPGDVGAFWLDDVAVHERRVGSHVPFQDDMAFVSLQWDGYDDNTVDEGSLAPFADTLRVSSTKSAPALANRSVAVDETDLTWTFHYDLERTGADALDPASLSTVLEGRDASGVTVWGLRLSDGRRLAVRDGGVWRETDTLVALDEWSLLEVSTTAQGYRVWNNTVPILSDAGSAVFGLGSTSSVVRLHTGGGEASYHLAGIEAFGGERPVFVAFERDGERWTPRVENGGVEGRFAVDGSGGGLPVGLTPPSSSPAGGGVWYAFSSRDAGATATLSRVLPLPERFEYSSWVWPGGVVTSYDGFSVVSFVDGTGSTILDVRLVSDVDDLAVQVVTPLGVESTVLRLPLSAWSVVSVAVEQPGGAYRVLVGAASGHAGVFGTGYVLGEIVLGDTKAGTSPSGGGSAFWDNVQVRTLNGRPVVAITSPVPDQVVPGAFWVNGTVTDDLVDRVKAIRIVPGSLAQVNPPIARVFSQVLDPSSWDVGAWYWIKTTVEDDDGFGQRSVRVCYNPSGAACAPGAPVNGVGGGNTNTGLG